MDFQHTFPVSNRPAQLGEPTPGKGRFGMSMFGSLRETVRRVLPGRGQARPAYLETPVDDETAMHSPCL
jgi:hypothetical protein